MVAGNLIAFFVTLPMALPLRHASPVDLGVILYLGVVQIGLAYMMLTRSIRHVPAVEAATLLLLEPVLNPVWTWITQGEKLSAATMAGGALIISAIFGSTLYQARQRVVAVSP